MAVSKEASRLQEEQTNGVPWKRWGPYLSERQWGTVREDYSTSGNAWDYFSHDQARSRAYRWGEDGLAGLSDNFQRLCFALTLWNGQDPILKERLFGLTNGEGNHGEDVKEYYYYLDATPTHSYLKYLYKYPQRAYPYDELVQQNRARTREAPEFELIDTGIFADNRYFDVLVEYAKAAPEDVLMTITVSNRGPEPASLHLLPTLWFRNTWQDAPTDAMPLIVADIHGGTPFLAATHPELAPYELHFDREVPLLFTNNETNLEKVFGRTNTSAYRKDGFDDFLVHHQTDAINPAQQGTKAAGHIQIDVPAGASTSVRLRLCRQADRRGTPETTPAIDASFDAVMSMRRREANEFYETVIPQTLDDDDRTIMRQALAGMLWSKQFYGLDVHRWIGQHRSAVPRNTEWYHMVNSDIISMPDKWEYPWYAAWDLAFHTIPLALVDIDFAKRQLELLLGERYQHPNGQLPAYEWNFSDVNPPVHAWAAYYVYGLEKEQRGEGDLRFLERAFQKLMSNFTWWVNRKDRTGQNVFDGGFLGLDNVGVFDRSRPLPGGSTLEQADGTAWMAFYCQGMLDIALELAVHDDVYEQAAYKYLEHFFWISAAMDRIGDHRDELWDEEDGFFYDVMRRPDGEAQRLKLRSIVGLLPLCATTVIEGDTVRRFPSVIDRARAFLRRRPDLHDALELGPPRRNGRVLLAVIGERKLRRVLSRMLDEREFLSPYGIRSLSRIYENEPYVMSLAGDQASVSYEPAESSSGMFGGNSNWRGPIWMPLNVLILRALLQYYMYFGDEFTVECPTGSGRQMTLFQVTEEINRRLCGLFRRDATGRRPVFGGTSTFQQDPLWRDHLLFYEYFHGDNGAGIGASHQTGWTGLVARMLQMSGLLTAKDVMELGRGAASVTTPIAPPAIAARRRGAA
jgi:hypothetical protein